MQHMKITEYPGMALAYPRDAARGYHLVLRY